MVFTLNQAQKMTLEEFFNYEDDTDAMYEFEDGELLLMILRVKSIDELLCLSWCVLSNWVFLLFDCR